MNLAIKNIFLLAILTVFGMPSLAEENPSIMVRNTSEQVRSALFRENGKNTDAIRQEVETMLLPRFDFFRMTALAVGKNWKQASPEQKKALEHEFKTLLTRTYFSVMLRYRDAKVEVKPDVVIANQGKEATVKSVVQPVNMKEPVAIDYVLYRTPDGWKVFNVNVEGASLVTVYRNQFGDEISKSGIDGLILSLHNKNQGSQNPPAKSKTTKKS